MTLAAPVQTRAMVRRRSALLSGVLVLGAPIELGVALACVEVTDHGPNGDPHVWTICGALTEGDVLVMKDQPAAQQSKPSLRVLVRAARVRALG